MDSVKIISRPDAKAAAAKPGRLLLAGAAASRAANSRAKRAFDILASLMLIAFIFPALVIIAILVKLDSKGSVIFRQKRSGLKGNYFHIYKFRSMRVMEDGDEVRQARQGDSRVTRVGGVLRRTSLDELPQIFNILKGDMSFVGPRPHALQHDKVFATQIADYNRRFDARPGLTGLAQVRGLRGEIQTPEDLSRRIESDIEYIDNWTFFRDIQIFFGTVKVIFGDRNAY